MTPAIFFNARPLLCTSWLVHVPCNLIQLVFPLLNELFPAERASGPVERVHEAGAKARPGAHDDSHIANAPGFSERRVRRGMSLQSQAAECFANGPIVVRLTSQHAIAWTTPKYFCRCKEPLFPNVILVGGRLYTKAYLIFCAGATAHPSPVGRHGGVDACHGRTGLSEPSSAVYVFVVVKCVVPHLGELGEIVQYTHEI